MVMLERLRSWINCFRSMDVLNRRKVGQPRKNLKARLLDKTVQQWFQTTVLRNDYWCAVKR